MHTTRLVRSSIGFMLVLTSACGDDAAGTSETETDATTDASTSPSTTVSPSTTANPTTTMGADTTDASGTTSGEESGTTSSDTAVDGTTGTGDTTGTGTGSESSGSGTDTAASRCGDGVVEGAEECDEGVDNDDNGDCKTDCSFQFCSDGFVGPNEECDDNNITDGDGCSAQCLFDGGDTCEAPFPVGALPFVHEGDTTNATNDYGFAVGACPGETGGWNAGSNDVVYGFTPAADGVYNIIFDATFDSVIYAATDCADIDNTCVQAAEATFAAPEQMYLDGTAGTTYYIIGGYYSNTSSNDGPYTITIDECFPIACDGTFCGDDGCGGTCACAGGEVCAIAEGETSGACEEAPVGDTCDDGIFVDPTALPFVDAGDTTFFSNQYSYSTGVCPGDTGSANAGSTDVVYTFTPDTTAFYTIEFDGTFDAALYIATDCDDIDNTCLGASETFGVETVTTSLEAGTTYFIIAGGFGNASNQDGPYTLTISEPCTPDFECDGVSCGQTNCGTTCDCSGADFCFDGTCGVDSGGVGDVCESAYVVDALPYLSSGDTTPFTNDYGYSTNVCPGDTGSANAGSTDVVYAFTPTTTGVYTIDLESSFDSALYIATDCDDIDNTCVGGSEAFGSSGIESVTTTLDASTTYFIIAGGFGNASNQDGPYTLTIGEPCIPDFECDGVSCGETNNCGITCGCSGGEFCLDGSCGADPGGLGDTCDSPYVIDALPYESSGDTIPFTNDYSYASGSCPGHAGGANGFNTDVVYAFTPTVTGDYIFELDASFDSVLYIATNCDDINNSCIGASETFGVETVTATLDAGTTYFIMGGGYGNFTTQQGPYTLTVDAG